MTEEKMQETVDETYACWLYNTGIGKTRILRMRTSYMDLYGKNPVDFAKDVYEMPEGERLDFLREVFVRKRDIAPEKAADILSHARGRLGVDIRNAEQSGLKFYSFDNPAFPERLQEIPDAPYAVYVRGELPSDDIPSVSIAGARMASPYGREAAALFGRELGGNGIQVISGMARGVDGISQRSALIAGGRSFGVLGCGADVIYPKENKDLYEELSLKGGVISEYPPGTPAEARLFPSRNRIISALSDLLLIVEAKERSGSLITTDYALEQGKEIYAVPGRITDRLSTGTNRLIRQGAGIATCPADVLEALTGVRKTEEDEEKDPDYYKKMNLQEPQASFYEALTERDLCDTSFLIQFAEKRLHRQVRADEVQRYMMGLIFKGLCEEAGVGIYQKKRE